MTLSLGTLSLFVGTMTPCVQLEGATALKPLRFRRPCINEFVASVLLQFLNLFTSGKGILVQCVCYLYKRSQLAPSTCIIIIIIIIIVSIIIIISIAIVIVIITRTPPTKDIGRGLSLLRAPSITQGKASTDISHFGELVRKRNFTINKILRNTHLANP